MSEHDAGHLASQLVRALSSAGVGASRLTTSADLAGLAVGMINGSHLGHTVLITTGGVGIRDFAWGSSYQHTLPITTPVPEVAQAIVGTLGQPFTDGVTPCRACRAVHPQTSATSYVVLGK